jgi:cellulase
MLYAYKCPGPANECKPSADDKGWALIDAAGYDVQRNGELWVQERFFNGESVPAPVPAGMPDGDYLFRHEIVALHRIPCEFYVSCTQVRIVGGASANMSLADAGAELVSFPGGYSGSEPGVTANVFGGVNKDTYQFPGPKLFNPSKSSSPPPETSDPEPTSTEDDSPEPTATSTEEGSSEPTSPAPSPTLTEDEPTATPTQCKMTRKQRRELRKARKARREMRKRAIAGREAHRRHKAALAALR